MKWTTEDTTNAVVAKPPKDKDSLQLEAEEALHRMIPLLEGVSRTGSALEIIQATSLMRDIARYRWD